MHNRSNLQENRSQSIVGPCHLCFSNMRTMAGCGWHMFLGVLFNSSKATTPNVCMGANLVKEAGRGELC